MVIAVAFVLYQLIYTQYILQDTVDHRITHLGFAFLIVFLTTAVTGASKYRYVKIALALLSLGTIAYVRIFSEHLQTYGMSGLSGVETAVGILIIILSLEATRQRFGFILPGVVLVFMVYALVGSYIPGPFRAAPISLSEWLPTLTLGFVDAGVFGMILGVSATLVFAFMIFAALVETTGAIYFFEQLGRLTGRFSRAGPAMAAVVTSGLVGSVSGQAGANVVITGSFTIPSMKAAGYSPEQAGAIEAAASTGGPLIPPIMGIAAFLMAGLTGIPYGRIIGVAILPAVLYMLSCAMYVQLQASKMKLVPKREAINYREMLLRSLLFFVPLFTIIGLFIMGYTPMKVGFWAVIGIFALSLLRKQTRPSMEGVKESFVRGARLGSDVAVVTATLGLIAVIITKSGLGLRIPVIIADFAGDSSLVLLILVAVVSSILGIGLPAAVAYVLVAITMAPPLVSMGIPLLAAHFFVFFFAEFSFITPPVAISVIYASRLAGSNFMKTAFEAVKVGIAGFVIPFAIVWVPAFVWDFSDVLFSITGIMAITLTFVSLQASIVGYGLTNLNVAERLVLAAVAFILLVHLYTAAIMWFAIGIGLLVIMVLQQLARRKRLQH